MVRWWVAGTALWLLLAATLARPDVIAAIAAGGLTAGAAQLLRRTASEPFELRWRWLRHLPQLPKQVLHDLGILAVALVRPSRVDDRFRALPFRAGDSAGRRGLLALATSLGPNTWVAGYDRERDLILVHQLVVNEQVLPLPDGKYPVP